MSLQPTFGKIYTFYNVKWTYTAALFIFEVGSLICGVAPNSTTLIIGRAIAGLDCGNLRKVAHSLKSSSANVGAETLAQMCKDMEQLGRTETTEGAAGILTDMEHEFQSVRHSLSAILEKEH